MLFMLLKRITSKQHQSTLLLSFSERNKKSRDGSESGTSGQHAPARTLDIKGSACGECSRVRRGVVLVDVGHHLLIDRTETPVVSVTIWILKWLKLEDRPVCSICAIGCISGRAIHALREPLRGLFSTDIVQFSATVQAHCEEA